MADAPRRPQTDVGGGDGAHQFIGMQTALHQQFALTAPDQFDRFGSCRFAVSDVDKFERCDIDLVVVGDGFDLGCGSDKNR